MKKKLLLIFGIILLSLSFTGAGLATPISVSGYDDEKYASFEGSMDYDPSLGTLTLSLTNTTDLTYPDYASGAITGIGFYFPELTEGQALKMESFTGDDNYPEFSDTYSFLWWEVPVDLKGYDFGAGTGRNIYGGRVANGIGVGESAQFTFGFSGSIADFTSESFASAQIDNPRAEGAPGVIRFQGLEAGGSAKINPTPGGGGAVPEPATVFLLGSGLLGLFGYRFKFWKSKS